MVLISLIKAAIFQGYQSIGMVVFKQRELANRGKDVEWRPLWGPGGHGQLRDHRSAEQGLQGGTQA